MYEPFEILIRESDLDTFGHVNNATYLRMFEDARWEHVTKQGYGLQKIRETQKGPVILEVQLKYLKEVRLRERVRIISEFIGQEGRISRLKQRMLKDDGSVACEALFVFGLFDLKERKLVEPTPEWKLAIGIP